MNTEMISFILLFLEMVLLGYTIGYVYVCVINPKKLNWRETLFIAVGFIVLNVAQGFLEHKVFDWLTAVLCFCLVIYILVKNWNVLS